MHRLDRTRTRILLPGQIIKRGPNRFLVRIARGRDANGKRLYHNKTIHGTRKDAQAYATKVQRELDTGSFVEASKRTLADFLREWLDGPTKQRVRPRTYLDYCWLAESYILPPLGARKLSQLHPADIQKAYHQLQARGLSARTIRYAHSVLHGALEQAVKWSLLARNPAKLVTLPRLERREMKALDARQAHALLAVAREDRWYALWLLLITGGLRPGEALGLKWTDLDGDQLRVQRTLVRQSDHRWSLTEPKTARARRVVLLPAIATTALECLRARQELERQEAGDQWNDYGLIFTTRVGEPLDYRATVRRHFKRLLKAANLPAIRPYDLRHTSATLLLAAGENIKVISERLGHTSSVLTLDVYSHVLPHMQQGAATKLEALLATGPSEIDR